MTSGSHPLTHREGQGVISTGDESGLISEGVQAHTSSILDPEDLLTEANVRHT